MSGNSGNANGGDSINIGGSVTNKGGSGNGGNGGNAGAGGTFDIYAKAGEGERAKKNNKSEDVPASTSRRYAG